MGTNQIKPRKTCNNWINRLHIAEGDEGDQRAARKIIDGIHYFPPSRVFLEEEFAKIQHILEAQIQMKLLIRKFKADDVSNIIQYDTNSNESPALRGKTKPSID